MTFKHEPFGRKLELMSPESLKSVCVCVCVCVRVFVCVCIIQNSSCTSSKTHPTPIHNSSKTHPQHIQNSSKTHPAPPPKLMHAEPAPSLPRSLAPSLPPRATKPYPLKPITHGTRSKRVQRRAHRRNDRRVHGGVLRRGGGGRVHAKGRP